MQKLSLVVGISDYPGFGADLSGVLEDVNDREAALKDHGFEVHKLYK